MVGLGRFLDPIAKGKADFVNGTRLVYPMEERAMKFVNYLGNWFFSVLFTWLLEQPIRDTLCGTKVLRKSDYERIKAGREHRIPLSPAAVALLHQLAETKVNEFVFPGRPGKPLSDGALLALLAEPLCLALPSGSTWIVITSPSTSAFRAASTRSQIS